MLNLGLKSNQYMEKLFQYQAGLLQGISNNFNRYLFEKIQWDEKPDKIYLENANLSYALKAQPD